MCEDSAAAAGGGGGRWEPLGQPPREEGTIDVLKPGSETMHHKTKTPKSEVPGGRGVL